MIQRQPRGMNDVVPRIQYQSSLTGGNTMAHQGYDNARQRRNDKRLALTAAYNAQHGIVEPESREVKRPTLRLNRKPVNRVDLAVMVHTTKVYDSINNCCLPEVAKFAAGFRKSELLTAR
ncbi:hypothetical protein AB8954_22495 [Yersinia enterocolitica]|uniref:transcriptional antitermination N peptide n=1 Tax=Yersinia enterocolitica TaxID=630 RepID=UPI003CFF9AF5